MALRLLYASRRTTLLCSNSSCTCSTLVHCSGCATGKPGNHRGNLNIQLVAPSLPRSAWEPPQLFLMLAAPLQQKAAPASCSRHVALWPRSMGSKRAWLPCCRQAYHLARPPFLSRMSHDVARLFIILGWTLLWQNNQIVFDALDERHWCDFFFHLDICVTE